MLVPLTAEQAASGFIRRMSETTRSVASKSCAASLISLRRFATSDLLNDGYFRWAIRGIRKHRVQHLLSLGTVRWVADVYAFAMSIFMNLPCIARR